MLRRYATALHLALATADVAVAAAVFVLLSILRFGLDAWQVAWDNVGLPWALTAVIFGLGWAVALWTRGLYRLRARWSIRREIVDIAAAAATLGLVILTSLFLWKLPDVSRLFLVLIFPTQIVVTLATRLALRLLFAFARGRGFNQRFVLVVGANDEAERFADLIERHPDLGLRVIGHLAAPGERNAAAVRRPIIGDLEDIEWALRTEIVDEIAVCLPPNSEAFIEPITRICEEEGRVVRVPVPPSGLVVPGGREETIDGMTITSLAYGPDRAIALVFKRLFDITISTLVLIVFSPVMAVISLAIWFGSGGPVLFSQVRVGLRGRLFRVVKFRTMGVDAETLLEDLREQNELAGPAFKMSNDPRISYVGRWLRRASVDELPQFWNVLRGEMSIVGPRPPLPDEVANYDLWHRRRLSMKPGITGLWQVRGRREGEFDRWVKLDLAYIDRWSLWLDVKIMFATLPAMLNGR